MTKNRDPVPGSTTPDSSESLIKNTGYEIGFSLVGVTDLHPSSQSGRVFDRWIREGRHGRMRYLSAGADKRHDPRVLFGGAASVICVGVNYFSRIKEKRNREAQRTGRGLVAMYAHGRDYHDVLLGMLSEFELRLKEFFPDLEAKAVVDTQPISERDLALKSGIAWLGKNTCVISPAYGSWIFLGELITNLSLEGDRPLRTLCGSCTRCMDACPTGALDEAYILDARKCISYLTIEERGEIPREFHAAIGRNLFGCDECQRVCPFNETARESVVFGGGEGSPFVDMRIEDLVDISDEDFRELTRNSAIRRCKGEGMRRNARIVADNTSPILDEEERE